MGVCYFCEKEARENYLGYYCETCRKIKNIGKVYGYDRIYNILNKCCIRDIQQLEKKINIHKKGIEKKEEKSDDINDYDNPDKIAEDENKEYFLRRKQPKSQYAK